MADDDRDPADPDRAAILARRQRFIALALSGLAGTAACDKPKPQPCLSPPQSVDEGADDPTEPKDTDTPPQPCLNVQPPEPDDPKGPTPQPCLEIAEPRPQPCLEVMPPPEEPKPQPCLRVVAPDPKPQPKPQPCLKVAPKGD